MPLLFYCFLHAHCLPVMLVNIYDLATYYLTKTVHTYKHYLYVVQSESDSILLKVAAMQPQESNYTHKDFD